MKYICLFWDNTDKGFLILVTGIKEQNSGVENFEFEYIQNTVWNLRLFVSPECTVSDMVYKRTESHNT